jgi:hypothetical protein
MLGKLTKELIINCCPAPKQHEIGELLSLQCSNNLPGVGDTPEWNELVDRIQLAVIRASSWETEKIKKSVSFANLDWRDLLICAGFGENLLAHKVWQQNAIKSHDISR